MLSSLPSTGRVQQHVEGVRLVSQVGIVKKRSESLQQLPNNWEKRLRVLVYPSGSAELCRVVLRWRSENVVFFENNEEWWGLPTAVVVCVAMLSAGRRRRCHDLAPI